MNPFPDLLTDFFTFIELREVVRYRKEDLGFPQRSWTSNVWLQRYRFCNVDRCDDTVTRWIVENVCSGGKHKQPSKAWFDLALCRFINWVPTLEAFMKAGVMGGVSNLYEWHPERFITVMEGLQAAKAKVYTGAYMIRAGTGEDAKMPKHEYLVKRVFTPLWNERDRRPVARGTCAGWDEFYRRIFGMGDFMRNQIITDLKYSAFLPKDKTPDWKTFVLAGPGTTRGLNRLFGYDLTKQHKQPAANEMLTKVRHEALYFQPLTAHGKIVWDKVLECFEDLNNVSNCFCEWDKYRRLVEGTGRPRSTYKPSTGV